jgi:hypothetical protein
MKAFVWLTIGIVVGVILTLLFSGEGRSAEFQNEQAYVRQVQSDLVGQQAALGDVVANVAAEAPQAGGSNPARSNRSPGFVAGGLGALSGSVIDVITQKIAQVPHKPEWQIHIDWAWNNRDAGGSTNCVNEYLSAGEFGCVIAGGRSCVMADAHSTAQNYMSGNYNANLDRIRNLVFLTQCHNDEAKRTLAGANIVDIANYVKAH